MIKTGEFLLEANEKIGYRSSESFPPDTAVMLLRLDVILLSPYLKRLQKDTNLLESIIWKVLLKGGFTMCFDDKNKRDLCCEFNVNNFICLRKC